MKAYTSSSNFVSTHRQLKAIFSDLEYIRKISVFCISYFRCKYLQICIFFSFWRTCLKEIATTVKCYVNLNEFWLSTQCSWGTSLCWDVNQRRLAVDYRRFGIVYRFRIQGSTSLDLRNIPAKRKALIWITRRFPNTARGESRRRW